MPHTSFVLNPAFQNHQASPPAFYISFVVVFKKPPSKHVYSLSLRQHEHPPAHHLQAVARCCALLSSTRKLKRHMHEKHFLGSQRSACVVMMTSSEGQGIYAFTFLTRAEEGAWCASRRADGKRREGKTRRSERGQGSVSCLCGRSAHTHRKRRVRNAFTKSIRKASARAYPVP
jgi:hypothetical protein